MSAYSDWRAGALTDEEYEQWGAQFNNEERAYEDRMYECMNEPVWDEEDEEYDEE